MPSQHRFLQLPLVGRVLLYLLGCVYLVYLVSLGSFVYTQVSGLMEPVVEHRVDTNPEVVLKHWTAASMRNATDADQLSKNGADVSQQGSTDINKGKAARQEGQAPGNGDAAFPLSTVGKVFFTAATGRDAVCSGTAVRSLNRSVVDTAGHCLYLYGGWAQNLIFCPFYDNGNRPYGCWAARDLEVPADWINAKPNDLHHDFGMAIVADNSRGALTDVVGGAGWAYNQSIDQPFYAYGYPAAGRFDGQSMIKCPGSPGTSWQHGGGTVVSIPCDMTGGSSGGPWFIKDGDNLYVNGHNDFTSSLRFGHMFSPYYDDTWYALYDKAQRT